MFDQGGYYVGTVIIDERLYGIAMSPKDGAFEGEWGNYGNSIDATSIVDGHKNTLAMAEAGSVMAQAALSLSINGHSDWYIPARDELEPMYRSCKPGTNHNYCGFKDGENISTVPVGTAYAKVSPSQTLNSALQTGAEDALQETWYWSSTQFSASDAFVQYFSDGNQINFIKDYQWRVRAVRRFLIN